MSKYSEELIINYINGDDLGEYSIDKLEDDKEFMIRVIEYSNDKEIYNLCSDSVKKDYDFVKYMVLKFKNDSSFIMNIADYFLDNTDTDYERIELSIIMRKLVNDKSKSAKYAIIAETVYSGKRLEVELHKLQNKDNEGANKLGMGFLFMYDLYNQSDIILKFYAEKMIADIFTEYDIDLESMLHSQFEKSDEINSKGLNNYMLNFIGVYDSMLASYASVHLDVLLSFKKKILGIQYNWDRYMSIDEKRRYEDMLNTVYETMRDADSIFTDTFLIYYIGKRLGILDKIKKYDCISNELYEYVIQDVNDEEFVEHTLKTSVADRTWYNTVFEIMKESLYSTVSKGNDEKKSSKCRILKLNLKKNSGNSLEQ